ncbi:far upstream element-binding protein 1 [Hordeum vulgare]|nr:far upstream element-binding protein 1 [Hordeum vulgare]
MATFRCRSSLESIVCGAALEDTGRRWSVFVLHGASVSLRVWLDERREVALLGALVASTDGRTGKDDVHFSSEDGWIGDDTGFRYGELEHSTLSRFVGVGVIIGKAGEPIKHIQLQSGAKIQVTRDMDVQPWSQTKLVDLLGTRDHISRVEQLISDVLAEAHAGSFCTIPNWKYNAPQPSVEQFHMQIANNKVIPFHFPPGDTSTERTLYIDGTTKQMEIAQTLGYE